MEDLLALEDELPAKFREKLSKNLVSIRGQVNRGMEIGERLNQFAHSMDNPRVTLDVNELLDLTVFLMERFASLRNIRLRWTPVDPPLVIDIDPFLMLFLFGSCIDHCLENGLDGDELTLVCERAAGGTLISCLNGRGLELKLDEKGFYRMLRDLKHVLKELGASIRQVRHSGGAGFELLLP
jgi:hypothetical protein